DDLVTGVQTCALPIYNGSHSMNGRVEYPDSPIEDFTSEAEQQAPKLPTPHPRKTVRTLDPTSVPQGHVKALKEVFEPSHQKDGRDRKSVVKGKSGDRR